MKKRLHLAIWGLILICQMTYAAKVLLIPNPMYSVCLELVTVGEELLLRGHDVTVYQMEGFHKICPGKSGMRVITYGDQGLDLLAEMRKWQTFMEAVFLGKTTVKTFTNIKHHGDGQEKICRMALGDAAALRKIEEEKFDFVLIDGTTPNACYAVIPYKLDIPFAAESCHFTTWPNIRPFMPHIAPDVMTPLSNKMDLKDTLYNAVAIMARYFYTMYTLPIEHVNKYAPEMNRKEVMDLLFAAELYLENDDPILGYAIPQMPRVVQVGGLLTKPAKSLPVDIESFLNNSVNGAIMVSFGSSTPIHKEIDEKFTKAFSQLNMSVLWKHNVDETIGNIRKMKWIPQNDVLAHPNVRLMVYHCGKNGVYEALYHGVPVVCFPAMYDHPQMASRVRHWKVGNVLELNSFNSDNLRDAIEETVYNQKYKNNMMKLSKAFHSYPLTPRQRAGYWLDHVIRHGGAHLKSSADNMPVYKLLMLDIYFPFFILLFFIIKFYLCVFRKCCGLFTKKIKANKRKQQ